MYEKGLLKLVTPPCAEADEEGGCGHDYDDAHRHSVQDSAAYERVNAPAAFLPHRCQEWVIGGPEEIRALIGDLQAALSTMPEAAENARSSSDA